MNGKAGTDASRCVLLEYLIRHTHFGKYLSTRALWAEKLFTVLTDTEFIDRVMAEEMTATGTSLLVTMPYTFLYFLHEESYKKAMEFLVNYVKGKDILPHTEDFINRNYFTSIVSLYEEGIFLNNVRNACMKTTTKHVQPSMSLMSGVSPNGLVEITYGRVINTWLDSKRGPRMFDLRTRHIPDNVTSKANVPFGCFHGDTEIQLYDAQTKKIQNLRQGDIILCGDGSKGLISSETVTFKMDNEICLFGFNNEKPFFTSSHPFWTQHGWKAIHPEGVRAENAWLMVGQLKEGDFVRKIKYHDKDRKSVVHTWEEIERIGHETYPSGTVIYGVHLREGIRSYHANGYVVHSNYSEITMDRIESGIRYLPVKEQSNIHHALSVLQPFINKLLGPGCGKAMNRMLTEPKYDMGTSRGNTNIHITDLTIPYMDIKYLSEATDDQLSTLPHSVGLTDGHLRLDGEFIETIAYLGQDMVLWAIQIEGNYWEYGCVRFYQSGLLAYGYLCRTDESYTDSPTESFYLVATTTNKYRCLISDKIINKNTKNPEMTDFGELEIGFKPDATGALEIVGNITLNDSDPLSPHDGVVSFFIDDQQTLYVEVNITPTAAPSLDYIRLTGQFDNDFSTFSGKAIAYDDDGEQFEGPHYHWNGTILPTEKSLLYKQRLAGIRRGNRTKMYSEPSSSSPFDEGVHYDSKGTILPTEKSLLYMPRPTSMRYENKTNMHSKPTNMHSKPSSSPPLKNSTPHPMMLEAASKLQNHLSVEELMGLTTPSKDILSRLSIGKLLCLSKYFMTDEVLRDIFGLRRPEIGTDLKKIADDNKDFLQNRLAVAYVLNCLKDIDPISEKMTEDDRRKLEYYFNPDKADKGINAEINFHVVNKGVSRLAFLDVCPDLEKYISSPQGGDYWAKQMLTQMTKSTFLHGLTTEQRLPQIQSMVQRYTTVLYCLAPKADYPQQFQEKVHVFMLNRMIEYFTGSDKDKDKMINILIELFNALFHVVVDGSDKIAPETRKSLMDELEADMNKYQMDLKTYTAAVSETFQSAAVEVVNSMLGSKGPILHRLIDAMKNNRNSFLTVVGGKFVSKILPLAVWGLSVFHTMFEYQHWDDLLADDKCALIAITAGQAFQLSTNVPDFLTKIENYIDLLIKDGSYWIIGEIQNLWKSYSLVDKLETFLQLITKEAAERAGVSTVDTISEAASVNYEVERWTFSRIAKATLKVLNILGLIVSSVSIGVSVMNDFIHGEPVTKKTLDILTVSFLLTQYLKSILSNSLSLMKS
jgi:hypothetical protein